MAGLIESVGPYGFWFKAYVIRWKDADTVEVKPQIYPMGMTLTVRIKDLWEPEIGEAGELEDRRRQEAAFPPAPAVGESGCLIRCKNDRINWPFGRLEARIDRTS